jgi:hypothetical protein
MKPLIAVLILNATLAAQTAVKEAPTATADKVCITDAGFDTRIPQDECLKHKGWRWDVIHATMQLIFTPDQAAYPGNAWMKPCGPDNHDDACVEIPPVPPAKAYSDEIKTISVFSCDASHPCIAFAPNIVWPEPEATYSEHPAKDGKIVRTLTLKDDWVCVLATDHQEQPRAVVLSCTKPPAGAKGGK